MKNYAALRGFHKTLTPLKIIGKKILSVAQMKFINVLLTDGGRVLHTRSYFSSFVISTGSVYG